MSGTKRQKQLARAKYERQQERRAGRAARQRRTQQVIAVIVVVALVFGGVAWFVLSHASSDSAPVAEASAAATPSAAASLALAGGFAVFHGLAHAVELPVGGNAPGYAAGFAAFGNNFAIPALFLHSFPAWFAGIAFAAIAIGALVDAAIVVVEQNGILYTLDKKSRAFTPYIDFGKVYARFNTDPNLGMGLVSMAFDPDYAKNGKFYTVHTENPRRTQDAQAPSNAGCLSRALNDRAPEHQELHERLLHVQAVFRLIPDDALRPVDHFGGHFFAAVRRQTVQE